MHRLPSIQSISSPDSHAILLAGLGNPGREHKENRHNVGFIVIDAFCQALQIRLTRVQSKALLGFGILADHKLIIAKPQTYMNLSGQSIASLVNFYKIPLTQLLVIHDDLDLPLGTLRIRPSGGSAGQKGLASIIQKLGSQDFPRLRVGIGRPPGQMDAAAYVLQDFSPMEQELLKPVLERAVKAVQAFITEGLEYTMNHFNNTLHEETPNAG